MCKKQGRKPETLPGVIRKILILRMNFLRPGWGREGAGSRSTKEELLSIEISPSSMIRKGKIEAEDFPLLSYDGENATQEAKRESENFDIFFGY